ncbi:MAG: energy-coupling factor transporter transmembrane protein EcfT [Coriobacteriaceae bacterium]|nr:energy-coupling factor transporter transmembrane protein EcfT [Coriobacteriaceae bacterium]
MVLGASTGAARPGDGRRPRGARPADAVQQPDDSQAGRRGGVAQQPDGPRGVRPGGAVQQSDGQQAGRPGDGRRPRGAHAFDLVHPAVVLGCFAAILALTMLAIHPVFLALSFSAAFSFSLYARGWRPSLWTLAWQVPLVVLCALVNPLFSGAGSTELFRIASRTVFVEGVAFGACMGLMLAAALLWFSNAALVLTSDKVLGVLGGLLPTVGLMVSMTMRLVPQLVERGRLIERTLKAASSARTHTGVEGVAGRVRQVSVLMGWSLEDSLETADAMRARAWGATRRRTTYVRHRFRRFDCAAAAVCLALGAASAVLAWVACVHYRFYPVMGSLGPWWGYLPFALFVSLPLLLCLVDDARWKKVC